MAWNTRFRGSVAPAQPVYRPVSILGVLIAFVLLFLTTSGIAPQTGRVPYLPAVYHQIDGTAFEQSNCVPSTTVMLIDRVTVGKWRLKPAAIRSKAGDTSGGMTYGDVAAAAHTLTGGDATFTIVSTDRAGMKALSVAGHPFGISIDAGVTINTPEHTGNYAGGHTIYVNQWRYNSTLSRDEYLVGDPGRGTTSNDIEYAWWPAWLLYKAAEARYDGHTIYLLVGRDTEGTTRTAVGAGAVRSGPGITYAKKGTLTSGHAYSVVKTTNGSSWTIGTHVGHGWEQIKWGTGTGWVAGGWMPR